MKKSKRDVELLEALNLQYQAFRQKFNRDPQPGEPIFFDPDADEPTFLSAERVAEITEEICEAMRQANVPPAIIYAYRKTGRIVTKENLQLLTRDELSEWKSAVEEYYSQSATQSPNSR